MLLLQDHDLLPPFTLSYNGICRHGDILVLVSFYINNMHIWDLNEFIDDNG
jgi:hypothetical protein